MGAVLETRLGDHATTREVLVGPEAEVEVRLDLLRFFRQASEPDRSVRVRIPDLRESALQEERGLQQAELQPTSDHLAEEPGLVEGTPLGLVNHDGAVPEEVHDDPLVGRADRAMAGRKGLPDVVVGQVALLVDEAQEEGLADRGRFLGAFQELRQVEHGPFAQRPDPVLARRLLRGASPRVHLEVDRAAPGFHDVSPLPQIPVDEVEDLERRNRGAGRPEEVPCGNGPASASHLEAFRFDQVYGLQEV